MTFDIKFRCNIYLYSISGMFVQEELCLNLELKVHMKQQLVFIHKNDGFNINFFRSLI